MSDKYSALVEEKQPEAILYCKSTDQFLVAYTSSKVKDFIKLPQVFNGETCSEAKKYDVSLMNITLQLQTFNDPSGAMPRVSGTVVPQSIDLQIEKIRKSKNQNDGNLHHRKGPQIWLAA